MKNLNKIYNLIIANKNLKKTLFNNFINKDEQLLKVLNNPTQLI